MPTTVGGLGEVKCIVIDVKKLTQEEFDVLESNYKIVGYVFKEKKVRDQ